MRGAAFLNWCRNHPIACFMAVSGCWVGLLYWHALNAPFVYDDTVAIQQNRSLYSWHSIITYFRSSVPLSGEYRGHGGSIYRPLIWFGFIVERHLWGLNASGYHLTNLLLHWINGILGFLLLQRLKIRPFASAATSLIWLGLPINSEAVAWVSGRHTCQPTLFIFLSLLAALSYVRSQSYWMLGCYFGALLAAVLSNEWGFLAVPLAILVIFSDGHETLRTWLPLYAVVIAVAGLYFALRSAADAHLPIHVPALLPVGVAFFQYLSWMVLPIQMSVERSSDTPLNVVSIASLGALVALLALIFCLVRFRQRIPLVTSGLTWMLLAILPFCGIVFIYQGMAERYTYLASAGLVFAIVALAWRMPSRLIRRWFECAIVLWALWGAWRLNARVHDWGNEITLFEASLKATPRSAVLLYDLGVSYTGIGKPDEAIMAYQRALELNPRYTSVLLNLGSLLRNKGDYPGALALYRRAITADSGNPDPWVNLGNVYFQTGSMQEARSAYEKAISLKPTDTEAITNLGAVFQRLGNFEAAKNQYERAIATDRTRGAPYCDLGSLFLAQGNQEAAVQAFVSAIRNDSSYAPAYFDLGALYEQTGNEALAQQMYERALQLQPDYEAARTRLDRLKRK